MNVTADDAVPVLLLGAPRLIDPSGTPRLLAAERPHVLLAWLALHRGWAAREALAALLYPDHPADAARRNLRKVLFLARKLTPAVPLQEQGELLSWPVDSDVQRFDAACRQQDWALALRWYAGPFLQGLDSACVGPLRSWLDDERRRLQARWHDACTRRLRQLQDDPAACQALAEQLLKEDPSDEVALEALGRAQVQVGQPETARDTLDRYRTQLADQLHLEPSAQVRRLWQTLQPGDPATPAAVEGAAETERGSTLVGRRWEQSRIESLLLTEGVRLLTLLGPGGIGKSALARDVARRLTGHWDGGAHWVPLQDLMDPDAVPQRIASAMGIRLPANQAPWLALAQSLTAARHLLVLDNIEQLDLAPSLTQLLQEAPGVQLLLTSREPAGLAEEQRLPLQGLPLPDLDETDVEVLGANDGVRLFERRACAVWPAFRLRDEAADVVRLLHAIDGLPLAIELLAVWRRLMPVGEMLQELQASTELLETAGPGTRSLKATFESSWRRLSAIEQRTLAGIASLPGPMPRSMARQVLQAPLVVLAHLVDKSLLQVDGEGSLQLHPLIRRLAGEHADDLDGLRRRHLQAVRDALADLGDERRAGLAWLDRHLAHLHLAWDTAVAQGDAEFLLRAAPGLERHADLRGHASASLDRVSKAREALAQSPGPSVRAVAMLDAIRASLLYTLGEPADCLMLTEQTLHQAQARHDEAVLLRCHLVRAQLHWLYTEIGPCLVHADRVRTLADRAGDRVALSQAERLRGLALKQQGDYRQALACYERALSIARELGLVDTEASMLNNIGNVWRTLGDDERARQSLQQLLALCQREQLGSIVPYGHTNLGLIEEGRGRLTEAAAHFEQALRVPQAQAFWTIRAAALMGRARCRDREADIDAAIAIGHRLQSRPILAHAAGSAGRLLALRGHSAALARRLLKAGMEHPALGASEREDERRWLAQLDAQAPAPDDAPPALLSAAAADAALDAALACWQARQSAPATLTSETTG